MLANAVLPPVGSVFQREFSVRSGAVAVCVDRAAECRVCIAVNQADDLSLDCDFFDDGLPNASCLARE